jgi:hypothetical protein
MNIMECKRGMIIYSKNVPKSISYKIINVYKNTKKLDVVVNVGGYFPTYTGCDVEIFIPSDQPDKTDKTIILS